MSTSRPDIDEVLLSVATVLSQRSTCSRLSVGAVLAREGRVLSTGYNGAPSGMPHCKHPQVSTEDHCRTAVHAESNTIVFAAKYGVRADGSTLYITHSPCKTCAFLIINAGVVRVVYGVKYGYGEGLDLLRRAGVAVTKQDKQ